MPTAIHPLARGGLLKSRRWRWAPISWLATCWSFVTPPADEQAQLQRAYIEAVKHQDALVARMERLAGLASLPPSQLRRA